jgi:hypothetical protein
MITVRITKLSGKPKSHINIGYWVEGQTMKLKPTVGKEYYLAPVNKTSLADRFDWFSTTPVIQFDGDVIVTQNSRWKLEQIEKFPRKEPND